MSSHPSVSHSGIGAEELDRIEEEIFDRVKNELGTMGKGSTIHYEPLKIVRR